MFLRLKSYSSSNEASSSLPLGRFGGAAVFNLLIISVLLVALQKTAFWSLKGGLLQPERPPFAMRFAVFYSPTNLPKGRLWIASAI